MIQEEFFTPWCFDLGFRPTTDRCKCLSHRISFTFGMFGYSEFHDDVVLLFCGYKTRTFQGTLIDLGTYDLSVVDYQMRQKNSKVD